jgi:hypothetical protein
MLGMGVSSAAGAAAHPDATTACGTACTDVSFQVPGPTDILAAHSGLNTNNNVVRLVQGSNSASKEDFSRVDVGTVVPLYCTATGHAQRGSVFTNNQCNLLVTGGLAGATTFQLAFNPNNGGPENECVGGWGNQVANGWKARLTPCGVAADTVIIRAGKLPGGSVQTGDWYINGASDNFSNPLVLTNPGYAPSQVTWSTVNLNGKHASDTQEVHSTAGPF